MAKANYVLRLRPSLKVAEKLSALETERYFRDRAQGAGREAFRAFLDGAGDAEPVAGDRLPG